MTPNTYCIHVIDAARLAFGLETVRALVYGNVCDGSETCIALEHVDDGRVVFNACSSQAFGVELHNSHRVVQLAARSPVYRYVLSQRRSVPARAPSGAFLRLDVNLVGQALPVRSES